MLQWFEIQLTGRYNYNFSLKPFRNINCANVEGRPNQNVPARSPVNFLSSVQTANSCVKRQKK